MRGGLYNPRPVDDTPVNGQLVHGVTSNRMFDHEADLDAHTRDRYETARTGEYLEFITSYSTVLTALAANTLYAAPIVIPRTMTFDRIAIDVTTLSGGNSARLGIYNDGANLYPGTLLLDAGVVSVAANVVVSVVINQQLTKGLYWVALVSNGTPTIVFSASTSPTLGRIATNFQSAGIQSYWTVAQAYGALPDPFTAGGALISATNGPRPFIPLRLLTLD